jgi:hypothetical protein
MVARLTHDELMTFIKQEYPPINDRTWKPTDRISAASPQAIAQRFNMLIGFFIQKGIPYQGDFHFPLPQNPTYQDLANAIGNLFEQHGGRYVP